MHIPSSGRPPVVYSKFTRSQQSLASLYTKMNPNLWHKAFISRRKIIKNKTYITDAKYDLCRISTQKLSDKCEGSYHLAICDLVGKRK